MSLPTAEAYDYDDRNRPRPRELCRQTLFQPELGLLTYRLLEEPLLGGERSYAISVHCTGEKALAECHGFEECRTIRDITTNRDLALRLFWQVCRGQVTPYGLLDVLPELLP